jgi:hypothetical protein
MEIKLNPSRGPKIKTVHISQDLSVNLKTKEKEQPRVNSAEKLRSAFEEAMSSLRMGPVSEDFETRLEFDSSLGECPLSLSSYHSILQTLLKLMWETHKRKYSAIVQGFQAALQEKLENTRKIIAQKRQLRESNESLLKSFQLEATRSAIVKFEDTWALELGAARDKFQDPTAGIETLVSKAMDFCVRINVEPQQVDVGDLLEHTDTQLKVKTDTLWSVWKLHVERHKAVFQGNLEHLQTLDRQIQRLEHSLTESAPTTKHSESSDAHGNSDETVGSKGETEGCKEVEASKSQENEETKESETQAEATSETEAAYKGWMEFVKLLSILKIDYDMRISLAKKATTWMSSKITESLHSELSRACMEIIESEQTSILKNREKMKEILADVQKSQGVIEAEIKRACNNVTSQYSSALTQMQLTCDLSLEAARETLYLNATRLVTRKIQSL